MIRRYDSVITVIDKDKKLALKFKIVDNKLYAYNLYLREENRNMLEVKEINHININSFIDKINENDLYDINRMKLFGIDTSDSLICTFNINDEDIDCDIFNDKDKVFFKEHNKNEKIDNNIEKLEENVSTDNLMLDYASTTSKALLKILSNMSISTSDKDEFNSMYEKINSEIDNYSNVTNNIDMLLLSTEILKLDKKLKSNYIPQYIKDIMTGIIRFDSDELDMNETNNAIMTDNNIDYNKVIQMIRNSIAHSNYKVLDDCFIEFYNEGKNKMNFTISKRDLRVLFQYIYEYNYICGAIPIVISKSSSLDTTPLNSKTLIKYLRDLEILGTNNIELKKHDEVLDNNLLYDLYLFDRSYMYKPITSYVYKLGIIDSFNSNLSEHLECPTKLESKKLSFEDIKYIFDNINDMEKEHFYSLSKSSQKEIIYSLIMNRYNKEYSMYKNLENIIYTDHFSNNDLLNNPYSYINYKSKVELLIMSFLNNMLLFCYNQNTDNISVINDKKRKVIDNSNTIMFPKSTYIDYLNTKNKLFNTKVSEIRDCRKILSSAKEYGIYDDECNMVLDEVNKLLFSQNVISNDINRINDIINERSSAETLKIVNTDIINKIRDSLAHGRVEIEVNDINDIISSNIKINDIYDDETQFDTNISLKELLSTIINPNLINTLITNNRNFQMHL